MLPKRGLTAFSYAAVKRDMPTEMANIERDALAFIHVVGLVSAVDMLLEPEIVLGLGRVSEIRSQCPIMFFWRKDNIRPDPMPVKFAIRAEKFWRYTVLDGTM